MKRSVIFGLCLYLVACGAYDSGTDAAPAPEIRWSSMDGVWSETQSPERRVLVNVYTDWCDFCRKMSTDVYPDSTVRTVVAEHFLTIGLNADSDRVVRFKGQEFTERALARRLGVRSYPTMVFMEPDGSIILQTNGFMPKEDFVRMLTYIGSQAYTRVDFAEFKTSR